MADQRLDIDISVQSQKAEQSMSSFREETNKTSQALDRLNTATSGGASSNTAKMARDFTLLERAGSGGLRSLAGGFGLVTSSAAAAGIAVGGLVLAAKQAVELGKLGAQAITAKDSFMLMMSSVGATTAELGQMQAAAGGTISTLKLLEMASYSVIGVEGEVGNAIANANDQLITIARAAYKARPSLQSVEFAYQSLVDGIKRVEKRLVDNLGLQVKAREANERYAESVGKSVDELTAQEVQLAFLNEVLRAGGVLVQQVGGDVSTMQDAFARAGVAATNLKVAIGEQLAPAVVEATNAWSDFIELLTYPLMTPTQQMESDLQDQRRLVDELRVAYAKAQSEAQRDPGGLGGRNAEEARIALEREVAELARLEIASVAVASSLTNASRVTREYAEDNSLLEAAIRKVSGAMFDLIGTAQDFATKQSSLLEKAQGEYDKALGSTVRSLSSLGASFGFATSVGEEHAKQVRQLTWLYDQGLIGVELYNYQMGILDSKMADVKDRFKETGDEVDEFTKKLRGLVESALTPSFDVEGLAPELSVREDEVDEHYRRLAAIALRGQEEIDKHQQDWADTLALIPEDVRAQGIAAMQQWAKDKVLAYDKGLDFSLINKDAIKKRIMEALLADEMKQQLIDEITAEMGGAVSEAQVAAAASSVLGGTPLGQITLGGVTFGPSETPPDMSAVAGQISNELTKAFKDRVDGYGMIKLTAQSLIKADKDPVKIASKSVGYTMADTIADAVAERGQTIVFRLASAIAPEVAAILERNQRRTGNSGR